MAEFVFNQAKGAGVDFVGGDIRALALQDHAALANITADMDDIAEILAVANVDECDFTNYARKVLANTTQVIDDANDRGEWGSDQWVYASAGGTVDNAVGAIIVFLNGANDAASTPLSYHDSGLPQSTNGSDFTVTNPNKLIRWP